jgi:hypothetical protein
MEMVFNKGEHMKPIEFEVDEVPQSGEIDANGNFKFYVYTSNQCDDDLEETLETLAKLRDLPTDVSLKINILLKDVYLNLYDMNNAQGKIHKEDMPLFESLRNDCQWIINEINKLEIT